MRCAALATTSFRKPNIRFHNSDHGDDDEDNDYDDGDDNDRPHQSINECDVANIANLVTKQLILCGKIGYTKSDEFSQKIQTAFEPPQFSENYIAIF